MSTTLAKIQSPIANALSQFEKKFRQSVKSKVPLLDKITHYIVRRKGKQMRPMFVFLSAKAINNSLNERSQVAATLVELLHTATLVHDDVVDDAYQRRGFFSINALWKNKIAVLVGDYFLSKGLLLAVEKNEFDLLRIVSKAVQEMSEGELLQIEKARRLDIKEDVYFDIIRKKTATLIASACASGAASVTKDHLLIEKMWSIGEKIGIAFQIKDDIFDYGKAEIGKPTGIDIQEKKMTLPLIYALNNAKYSDRRMLINIVKNHNKDKKKVQQLIDFVIRAGGIEYAEEKMNQYKEEAIKDLRTLGNNDAVMSLEQLIEFSTTRKK